MSCYNIQSKPFATSKIELFVTKKIVKAWKLLLNVVWAWETVVPDNKFAFSNCENYIVLLAGKIFIFIHPTLDWERINLHFKMIIRTLLNKLS